MRSAVAAIAADPVQPGVSVVRRGRGMAKSAIDAAIALLERAHDDIRVLSDLEGQGPVADLEAELPRVLGGTFAVATSSGCAAITGALAACGVGKGDEVIVSAYGWPQTPGAVLALGALPRFADIDPVTFVIDPDSVRQRITARTRAILVTHLFGQPGDMHALERIARANSLALVADGAQADGARLGGQRLGCYGDAMAVSFSRGKLITGGEGGAVVCRDRAIYERTVLATQHPLRAKRQIFDASLRERIHGLGPSARMHPLAACLVRAQLPFLDDWHQRRRQNCLKIIQALADCRAVRVPREARAAEHGFHTFALTVPGPRGLNGSGSVREQTLSRLRRLGVPVTAGPVGVPLHHRVAKEHDLSASDSCPVAEDRCRREEAVLHDEAGFLDLTEDTVARYRCAFNDLDA